MCKGQLNYLIVDIISEGKLRFFRYAMRKDE